MMLIKSITTTTAQTTAETTPTNEAPRPKLRLIENRVDVLDLTRAVIVNREQLTEALKDTRHVSAVLHNVENLDDLDWQEMTELCRAAHRAVQLLSAITEAKEVQA